MRKGVRKGVRRECSKDEPWGLWNPLFGALSAKGIALTDVVTIGHRHASEARYSARVRNRCMSLSDDEARELKSLYRSIVRELHPDLHPNLDNSRIELFHNAVLAFESADVELLREIAAVVCEPVIPLSIPDGFSFLVGERERLQRLVQGVKARIALIKSEYPYIMKSVVGSSEKTEARKAEPRERLREATEILAAYTERMINMTRLDSERYN